MGPEPMGKNEDEGKVVPLPGKFEIADAQRVLAEVFAPWVQDLGLAVERIEVRAPEPGAVLRMAFSDRLCREGGVVCGQALMSLADTAMVFAVSAACGGYRRMTTVDQTAHFLKPVAQSDVLADARIIRLGKTMAFGRVTLTAAGDGRPVAMVSSAYALL
jgi:uncharacterized protein (TIGR00369 family)